MHEHENRGINETKEKFIIIKKELDALNYLKLTKRSCSYDDYDYEAIEVANFITEETNIPGLVAENIAYNMRESFGKDAKTEEFLEVAEKICAKVSVMYENIKREKDGT